MDWLDALIQSPDPQMSPIIGQNPLDYIQPEGPLTPPESAEMARQAARGAKEKGEWFPSIGTIAKTAQDKLSSYGPQPIAPGNVSFAGGPVDLKPAVRSQLGSGANAINDYMDQMAGINERKRALLEESGVIESGLQESYAQSLQGIENAQREYQIQEERKQQERDAMVDRDMENYRNSVSDYMNTKVDPHHWFNSSSEGTKIATVISMILGGLGNILRNKPDAPNPGIELLKSAIQQDLSIQEMEIEKKGKLPGIISNEMDLARQHFGDQQQARLAAMNTRMEQAKTLLSAQAAQSGSQQAVANSQMAIADIDNEQAKNEFTLKQMRAQQMAQNALALHRAQAEMAGPIPGYTATSQLDKAEQKDVKDRFSNYRAAKAGIARLKGLVSQKGSAGKFSPDLKDRYKSIISDIKTYMAQAKGIPLRGAAWEAQAANLDKAISTLSTGGGTIEAINELEGDFDDVFASSLEARGLMSEERALKSRGTKESK